MQFMMFGIQHETHIMDIVSSIEFLKLNEISCLIRNMAENKKISNIYQFIWLWHSNWFF